MLEMQVKKLTLFVVKNIMTLPSLQKRVINSGNEFQKIQVALYLENNCLCYVGLFI